MKKLSSEIIDILYLTYMYIKKSKDWGGLNINGINIINGINGINIIKGVI